MRRLRSSRAALLLALPLLLSLAACEGGRDLLGPGPGPDLATVPEKGGDATLDLATWNIEWFGHPDNGPDDEQLQLENARDVINGADLDIWGVQEISDLNHWNDLESQLTGFTGFLANEDHVVNGPEFYSDFGDTELKVGIAYKDTLAELLDARVVLTEFDHEFAGRPPLQVTLRVTMNDVTEDIVVIILHMKCCTDGQSYNRRKEASEALKAYLDSSFPTQKVWVIGDWNDDVDESISGRRDSPYQNFVDDSAEYTFPTGELSDAGESSTTGFSDMVDHQLDTDESFVTYVDGSAEVYRVDEFISGYESTTSDHFPVLARHTFGDGDGDGDGSASPKIWVNEFEQNPEGADSGNEWAELHNPNSEDVDVSGWVVTANGGSPVSKSLSGTVPAGGYMVVEHDSQWLDNSDEWVTLEDDAGALVDETPVLSDGENDGRSQQRTTDGGDSWKFETATREASNG